MSVISVGGRRYAAGLYWLERGGPRATARTARRLGRPWCVHRGERTGFAADDPAETGVPETLGPESPEGAAPAGQGAVDSGPSGSGPEGLHPAGSDPSGLPALALALEAHIEGTFWMALVEGDRSGDGGGPGESADRYALVKARGGTVLADGDEVFEDREAALAAFERARGLGWALFATPGLVAELGGKEVAVVEPAALGEAAAAAGAAIVLGPAVPARAGRRVLAVVLGVAVVAAGAAWFWREALIDWLAAPQPTPMAARPEPTAAVAVDGAALIAACRGALIENPPFLPAWGVERIECAARLKDPELTGLVPELAERPVLLVRWRLAAGHGEALQRRLTEAHLVRWHAAQVADGRAWAVAPLGPVLRIASPGKPSFLELRRAMDRAFGAGGGRIGYARNADGTWSVRIDEPGPLARLGPIAGGIDGLEITALARGEDGPWRLDGRPAAPQTVAVSKLAALGVPGGDGAAEPAGTPWIAGNDQPNEETDHGTHDGS